MDVPESSEVNNPSSAFVFDLNNFPVDLSDNDDSAPVDENSILVDENSVPSNVQQEFVRGYEFGPCTDLAMVATEVVKVYIM
ncbi:hypothetical protein LINPERPRIM_LOCUS2111 [Linum perenne]